VPRRDQDMTDGVLRLLADELAERVAEHLAPRVAELVSERPAAHTSPWLTTSQAIEYSRLPEGTFRKLVTCGKIPCHGGRAKLFYRPELDQALLDLSGLADDSRRLRRVR
jgi:hypothetical protein